jgi:carboxypeptidase family protein
VTRFSTRRYLSLLLCFALSLIPRPSFAQQGTTAIVGDVTDPQGAAVNGAKVTLADPSSAVSRETMTDEQGHFQFLSLQPGTYTLRIEATGFKSAQTAKIEALVSSTQKINIKLELGTVSDTVTVTEGAVAPVNTTDATLGNAFDSRQILALPFEGRDAAGVLSLQPGVTYVGTNPDDNVDTRNGALNGGRSDQANITLDGVDNNQQARGTAFQGAVRSTLDSIEEFRVTTAGDNADQGRSSGGQVTLVTKSGTNTFHGSLYEQHRPTITAANDWFNKHAQLSNGEANTPGKVIRNTFGGSLGGPILKDRLFFFGTYEGQRLAENQQVSRNIPSANLQDGVVLYPCADVTQCPGGNNNLPPVVGLSGNVYSFAPGTNGVGPAQIKQMDQGCLTTGTCTAATNGINQAAISQVFSKYRTANSQNCGNADGFNISCFTFSAPNPQRLNTSIARIDYNLTRSGSHRIFARGNYQTDKVAQPPQFPGDPPNNIVRDTSRSVAVGYTAVLSNTVVNSFHYGLTRQSRDNLGIENGPLVTFRFYDDLHPNVASVSPSTSFTTKFHIPVHNWVDDVTWTKGKHTLQFGANLRGITNTRATDSANLTYASTNPFWLAGGAAGSGGSLDPGAFNLPAVDPNNSITYDIAIVNLVGLVPEVVGQYNRTAKNVPIAPGALVPKDFRSWETDLYAQDSWHITPNLTITAGLRYSLLQPVYETNGNQVSPNFNLSTYVSERAAAQLQGQTVDRIISYSPSGQANGKAPYWPWDYKDLGPRVAIAYAPNPSGGLLRSIFGGAGKSSIRAGFGIVYDHFGESLINTFDQNGSFGLDTVISNPASVQTIDGSVRFTGLHDIPSASPDGLLLNPAPTGPFPFTPPVSTLGHSLQQITWGFDNSMKTPYSELVDFSVTRELPGGLVLEAAYVGRFAHRLLQQRDLAMPLDLKDPKSGADYFAAATQLAKLADANTPVSQVPNIPYWQNLFPSAAGVNGSSCGDGVTPGQGGAPGNGSLANPTSTQSMYELFFCNWGASTIGATNFINVFDSSCVPACANINGVDTPYAFYNKEFSALYAWSSIGSSAYNAGQFTLRSQPHHGLQFDFNYVLSKSLDIGSDAERVPTYGGLSAIINTWAPKQLRGPSDFDARHQINSNWVYDLPLGRGRRFGNSWNRFADALLGGWQLSGIYRWTSGFPFSVDAGGTFNTNFQLEGKAMLTGPAPSQRLTFVNGQPFAFKFGTADPGSFFRLPYPGESGARNNFRGQGFFGIDMGVNKTFRFTERHALRFSAYAYNLTNSVRFDPATLTNNSAVTNPTSIGLYSGTLTKPRVMEFALRYQF